MVNDYIAELASKLDMSQLQRLFSKPINDIYAASLYRCSVNNFRKAVDYRNNVLCNNNIGFFHWVEACRCESKIKAFDYAMLKMESNPDANMFKNIMESLETPLSKIKFPVDADSTPDYADVEAVLGEEKTAEFFGMIEKLEMAKNG